MREQIRNRPVLWLVVASVVALFIGAGIGATGETPPENDSDLALRLADAQDAREEAEDSRDRLQDRVDNLTRRLGRQQRTQARQSPREPVSDEPDSDSHAVDDFSFADVQVREDSVGDFEVRVRVTNNGGAVDLADMQVTLFQGGSVVADAQAVESFEAGQTRTVTLISSDDYGDWDDIEFTVDRL